MTNDVGNVCLCKRKQENVERKKMWLLFCLLKLFVLWKPRKDERKKNF